MTKTITLFAAAVSLSVLAVPAGAQGALEQARVSAPAIEFSVPAPAAELTAAPGPSREEALKKLQLFAYQKSDVLSVKRNTPSSRKEYSKETIELRLNDPLRQLGEFTQKYVYYRTKEPGPRPAVVVFAPFSGSKTIDAWAAVHFAKRGYNAVVIVPHESLADKTRPLDRTDDLLIREMISAKMLIDLLETFPEVDAQRIYANGISMGGIRTALAFGVEPRIKKAVEIVGGGDLPGIIADTHFKLLKGVRDARMAIEGIKTIAAFRLYMKKAMTVDPLDFASLRDPEDLMVVMGEGDRFVPDAYQQKLYDAFSRPAEGRYPALLRSGKGHLVTAIEIGKYVDEAVEFFGR